MVSNTLDTLSRIRTRPRTISTRRAIVLAITGTDMIKREHGRRDKNDVFVGNIPYGTTEEQLHEIFSEAGGVLNIRLVSDHETGMPKGYAFVEYEDAATALSAIRNLNGFECNGRPLRVNYSNNSFLGVELQRGDKAPQQERTVKSVVMQMGVHEVYDVVSNMKQLVEKEPDKAKQMFVSHPQVAEALLHMQVRLGLLKADEIPSFHPPPPPPVVGGAIMLGKGAQLPKLVPPTAPKQGQQAAALAPTAYPSTLQPPRPPRQVLAGQALGWGQGQAGPAKTNPPLGQFASQQIHQGVPLQPPPAPPQQPPPIVQPPQSQSTWGSKPPDGKPADPRQRLNR